jgi:hypothetical protein
MPDDVPTRGFQRDLIELLLRDLDELALVELVSLDDVLVPPSSPVSAPTLRYLIRWPGCLLSWLKLIFSDSEVAG